MSHVACKIRFEMVGETLKNFKEAVGNMIQSQVIDDAEKLDFCIHTENPMQTSVENQRYDELDECETQELICYLIDNGIFDGVPVDESVLEEGSDPDNDQGNFYELSDFKSMNTPFGEVRVRSCYLWMPFD